MKTTAFPSILLAAVILFLAAGYSAQAAAADLYVSTAGDDSNPGTQAAPFRTITKAAKAATPGTTVHVAPGTYAGSVVTETSGTETARIRYVSDTKWGARLIPPTNLKEWSDVIAWYNRGNYVDIDGFDIDGQGTSVWLDGIATRASNTMFQNNHIHHIADTAACNNSGGSAINTTHYEYGENADVIGNVIDHIGYAGCIYIQGIYIGTTGEVKNNLVYAVGNAGIHLWHDATRVVIANNTIFNSGYGIIVGSGDFYHNTTPVSNTLVHNNIVFDNLRGIQEQGQVGINNFYVNNLVYQNSMFNWGSTKNKPVGSIAADPQFVSYNRDGGGDYRLKSTSPAVDAGSGDVSPGIDIGGIVRPRGAGVDIGAYESY
ncbi:MAG: hypothetical protein V7642_3050 [Burkholderiales bacterium]